MNTLHKKAYYSKKVLSLLLIAVAALFINSETIFAGEQAERAIAGVKELVASDRVPKDAVIRFVAKGGSIYNFWGNDFELKREWENQTGIRIEARVRPNLPVLEFMRKDKDFDITLARVREYPDLLTENLIVDLTPFVKKYGVLLDDNPVNGLFSPKIQTEFDDRIVAIPADGDIAMLYLRKDLMEDPTNKARFKKKFNRELTPPRTWEEYQDLIEFFHNPQKGIYGSCENRDPQLGWMCWFPRYACQAAPNQYLFDDDMHPLINSPEGVAATKSYLKTIPFSPPKILEKEATHNYTGPIYRDGHGFAYILTMAMRKMFDLDFVPIKGKVISCLMPGKIVGNRLVRRSSFIFGNNIVVARSSKYPELVFLYAMWISDPDISTRSILVTSGQADPYRVNHLKDERAWPIYTKQALDVLEVQAKIAVPPGTGLPGDFEYMRALNKNLNLAGRGKLTAKAAMEKTAREWERITEKYGREKQIRYWRAFRKKYPQMIFPLPQGLRK